MELSCYHIRKSRETFPPKSFPKARAFNECLKQLSEAIFSAALT